MAELSFPVLTISGSMRYFDLMMEEANEWTAKGYIVLMPFVTVIPPDQQAGSPVKAMLDEMHFTKISMSELVIVVGGYIGESTHNEIEYAALHQIPVRYVRTNVIR
jgi:hypothetical protein